MPASITRKEKNMSKTMCIASNGVQYYRGADGKIASVAIPLDDPEGERAALELLARVRAGEEISQQNELQYKGLYNAHI